MLGHFRTNQLDGNNSAWLLSCEDAGCVTACDMRPQAQSCSVIKVILTGFLFGKSVSWPNVYKCWLTEVLRRASLKIQRTANAQMA